MDSVSVAGGGQRSGHGDPQRWPPDEQVAFDALRARGALEQLQRILASSAASADPIALLDEIAHGAATLLGAQEANIYLLDAATNSIRRVASSATTNGSPLFVDAHAQTPSAGLIDAIDSGRAGPDDTIRSDDGRSIAAVMRRRGEAIGIIELGWNEPVSAIDRVSLTLVNMLTSAATIAVNQANATRLVEESVRMVEATVQRASDVAAVDVLTGLVNRGAAHDRIDGWNAPFPPAVIAIDLDRFRVINEAHGMGVGDEVLRGIADRLRSATRVDDVIARVAGDEFIVVIEAQSEQQVSDVSQRISAAMREPIVVAGEALSLTASIGAAVADPGRGAEVVMLNAALARAEAKRLGGDRVVHFDSSLGSNAFALATLERELSSAIATDQFELYYQPLVSLPDRRLVGAEALVRWNHPTRGRLTPSKFLPLAETIGQIGRIDRIVLSKALAQVSEWERAGRLSDSFRVSVNVSADRFNEPDLVDTVISGIAEGNLVHRLRLELTETGVMGNETQAVEVMTALRSAGVQTSLDDFGTGWSSLSYLKRFPINAIKVDRAFVTDIVDDADDAAIVAAIVALAKTLGLGVLAEGIEHEAQERLLFDMGCEFGQGFLYDRPLSAGDFERRWLRPAD